MEMLSQILGHGSVVVTERYAHPRPDLYRPKRYNVLPVSLRAGNARVAKLLPRPESRAVGYAAVTIAASAPRRCARNES